MILGGLQKISLIDYPGRVSSVVFTAGCNLRCPFCHNPQLIDETCPQIDSEDVLAFLASRQGKIDGVVLSGGEPTLQDDLFPFLKTLKTMGFDVKLDTNGSNPSKLASLISKGVVDFVALDYKVPFSDYRSVGWLGPVQAVIESLSIVSRLPNYEIRTTIVPQIHQKATLLKMASELGDVRSWVWQQFSPKSCLDHAYESTQPYDALTLQSLLGIVRPVVPAASLRGI